MDGWPVLDIKPFREWNPVAESVPRRPKPCAKRCRRCRRVGDSQPQPEALKRAGQMLTAASLALRIENGSCLGLRHGQVAPPRSARYASYLHTTYGTYRLYRC